MPYPTIPTPYEYALMSQAAYFDKESTFAKKYPKMHKYLQAKGWRISANVRRGEYFASIWTNDTQRQVVIAHRGSQNLSSWLTDIESVVLGKPGAFVRAAIDILSNKLLVSCYQLGFRVSTTGHSLCGFLAQICMYWAERRDFQIQNAASHVSAPTGQPILPLKLSAVVFDSPGVASFIKRLHSNLLSEQETIDFKQLNVHNFCAMPTIVSTYGIQVGTIWHLGGVEELHLAFVHAHQMNYILQGFDPKTGQPKQFRQMMDWPRADYRAYSTLSSTLETSISKAIKAPFAILNALYKHLKGNDSNTWFDQLCQEQNQILEVLNHQASKDSRGRVPRPAEVLDLAIKGHYSALPTTSSRHHLALYHIDSRVQTFLCDLHQAKVWGMEALGWHEVLQSRYGLMATFLTQLTLVSHGKRTELILAAEYPGTVFDAYRQLLNLLDKHGTVILAEFMQEQMVKFRDATKETLRTTEDIQTIYAKINQLETHIQERVIMSLQEQWFRAATEGNIGVLNTLLRQNSHLLNVRDAEGHTALLLAAKFGQTKTLEFLVDEGALVYATNMKGQNAAYLLALRPDDNTTAINYLAKTGKLDLNQPDEKGVTPLMRAAYHGHESAVKVLCSLGADCNAKVNNKWTASALARSKGHINLADIIDDKIRSHTGNAIHVSSSSSSYETSASYQDTFSLDDINNDLKQGFPHLQRSKGQRLVLIIGDTRVGKSVVASTLIGYEMEKFRHRGQKIQVKGGAGYTSIGHEFTAETPFAIPVPSPDLPFLWVDCPGFDPNRSREQGVVESLSLELTIAQSESIEGIVLVIRYNHMDDDLTNKNLQTLMLRLNQLFTDPAKIFGRLCIVVSQTPQDITREEAMITIRESLEGRCKHLKRLSKDRIERSADGLTREERSQVFTYMTHLMNHLDEFVFFDPLEEASAQQLISQIKAKIENANSRSELKITKQDFNFFSNYDGSRTYFNQVFCELIEQNKQLLQNIYYQKGEAAKIIKNIKINQANLNIIQSRYNDLIQDVTSKNEGRKQRRLIRSIKDEIKSNIASKDRSQAAIEKNLSEIEKIKKLLKKINTSKLITYENKHKKSTTSFYSMIRVWNDWCIDRLDFSFNTAGIPIRQVESTAVPKGYGKWGEEDDDRSSGRYKVSYLASSTPYINEQVTAGVSIYVRQRDLPENAITIRNMSARIRDLERENRVLAQTLRELNDELEDLHLQEKNATESFKTTLGFETTRQDQIKKAKVQIDEFNRLLINLNRDLKDHQAQGVRLLERYRVAHRDLEIILTLGWWLREVSGVGNLLFNALLNQYQRLQRHLQRGYYAFFGWTAVDQEKYKPINYRSGMSHDGIDDVFGHTMTSSVALTPQGVLLDEFALLSQFKHGYHEPVELHYPDGTSEVLQHNQWYRGTLSEMQLEQLRVLNARATHMPTMSSAEPLSPQIRVDSSYVELPDSKRATELDMSQLPVLMQEAEDHADVTAIPAEIAPVSIVFESRPEDAATSSSSTFIIPPPPPPPPLDVMTASLPKELGYLSRRATSQSSIKMMPSAPSREAQLQAEVGKRLSRLPSPPAAPTTDSENEWSDEDMESEFGFKIDAAAHIPSRAASDMGPAHIPGWQFLQMPEKNSFYEAVVDQLRRINHDWISSLSYEDRDFPEIILLSQMGDIELDREKVIGELLKLGITLAIFNVNERDKGFVAYYTDANQEVITNRGDDAEQQMPEDKPIIRIGMRANHYFSSVTMHPALTLGAIRTAWDGQVAASNCPSVSGVSSSSSSSSSSCLPSSVSSSSSGMSEMSPGGFQSSSKPTNEAQERMLLSGKTLVTSPSGTAYFTAQQGDKEHSKRKDTMKGSEQRMR